MWLALSLWVITALLALIIGVVWRSEVREATYRIEDAENEATYWKRRAERMKVERDRARHESEHLERSLDFALRTAGDLTGDIAENEGN